MTRLSRLKVLALVLVAGGSSIGCGAINAVRSRNELQNAAKAYKGRKLPDAEAMSRRALALDPTSEIAQLFVARITHAQYRVGDETPDNVRKGEQAVEEYKKYLVFKPDDEISYKAVVALLGSLKKEDEQRKWLMERSNNSAASAGSRAEALLFLASKEYQCSNDITESSRKTTESGGNTVIAYEKPKDAAELDKAKQCVQKGTELTNKALELDPNSDLGWSYRGNLLLEQTKFAEMEGNKQQKDELKKQADQALVKYTALAEEKQKKKEEEDKRKAAEEAAKEK